MFQPKVQRELVEKESCEKNKLLRDRVAHPLMHMHTSTLAPIFQHIISHPHTLCGFPSRLDVGRVCSTAFGKHCEFNAHKFTHLKRLPPLGSHLLLLSHCVLNQHEGQKKSYVNRRESNYQHLSWVISFQPLCETYFPISRELRFVLSNADFLNYKSQLVLRTEKFS